MEFREVSIMVPTLEARTAFDKAVHNHHWDAHHGHKKQSGMEDEGRQTAEKKPCQENRLQF